MIIRKFSNASLGTKVMLFKVYCTQLHGCPSRSATFEYLYNKLNVAYNDAFRLLLKEPKWCSASKRFALHNVTSFDAMIRKLVYSFWISLRCGANAVVHAFVNSDMFNCSQIVRRRHAIFFNF